MNDSRMISSARRFELEGATLRYEMEMHTTKVEQSTQLCLILITLFGAMHIARRVEPAAVQTHGIALGAIASIVNLIVTGISSFNLGLLLTTILIIRAGWLESATGMFLDV